MSSEVVIGDEDRSKLDKMLDGFGKDGKIAVVAFYLGSLFGIGGGLFFLSHRFYDFGLFLLSVAIFHLLEFLYMSKFRPKECTVSSFLIDHSRSFVIAFLFGLGEYFLEMYFVPWMKGYRIIVYPAFLVVVFGQIVRTMAMFQAGRNFNHIIEYGKREDHKLVTSGMYAYSRHPSYMGWFVWAVFTQAILMNPVSACAYAFVSFEFFSERIEEEELTLVFKFQNAYREYAKKVPVGIPFLRSSLEERLRKSDQLKRERENSLSTSGRSNDSP